MHKKDFFSLYIFFISVVFTQLPRTPNHFPLPRLWTLDRDFGPTTPDSRLLVKLSVASWNLFTLTAEADSFVSTCDVFNCFILLDVQNDIQLLSRVFCYSWLVCLLGFWLRNTSLVFRIASFSFFTLLDVAWNSSDCFESFSPLNNTLLRE